ncbi:MAG: glycosyltransferase [Kiritimatiellaeota bacterium]|nr:glycosyltransferase [Kiritimatiellota bacterium]
MCYNEEKRIEYAIRNFKGKFKIMVVDNIPPSTDRTREICERHGVEYVILDRCGHAEQPIVMNELWKKITTDYMIYAMCAEYVPDELLHLYAKVANEKSYDTVCALRVSIIAGKHVFVWGRAYNLLFWRTGPGRFNRRDSVNYENNPIHRYGKLACDRSRVLKASNDPKLMFYQFQDYDTAAWEKQQVLNRSDIEAQQMCQNGERYSFFKMIYRSLREFIIAYFIYGAYQDGHLGFMHSYFRFTIYMSSYMRLWDIEHNLQKDQIVAIHNTLKEKLLSKEITVESLLKR